MAIIKLKDLRNQLSDNVRFINERSGYETLQKYAERKLLEQYRNWTRTRTYDIFLSHSFIDAPAILMLSFLLESQGLTVYVDWIEDPLLDRTKVNTTTASTIRERMRTCKSLLLALTSNSAKSSWVQWELGLGDGQKNGKVAIVPLYETEETIPNFYKQEYLGLYPYITKVLDIIVVNGKINSTLNHWLTKSDPLKDMIYG